jgi:hypothetical protein
MTIKEIRVLNAMPLYDYRQACAITEGRFVDVGWQPKNEKEYWIKQIVANHSCLRAVEFRYTAEAPKSVVMQIIRATKGHPQPFVQSSRPDWNNGKERSSDPYEEKLFIQDHTAESFIEMAKQRLCKRTEQRTRDFMKALVEEMKHCGNPFLEAVAECCHPACWWLGGCPEFKGCENVTKIASKIIEGVIK